ncbi:MAG TPA: transcriptional regulator, partial [Campylobacterales bacterium]|nr:transcriptional regulator [Campylobacterales bacterium]
MMGISTKSIYAVAALYQLSLLEANERLNIKTLAIKANAPEKFLGQILLELKKAKVLNSTKGANGGYALAKALHEITLKEIVTTLETNAFEEICQTNDPTLTLFWEAKRQAIIEVFDTPLSELTLHHETANQNFTY